MGHLSDRRHADGDWRAAGPDVAAGVLDRLRGGAWYWQIGVPALICAMLVAGCGMSSGLGLGEATLTALFVQVALWTLVALLMPLRAIRGWRLNRGGGQVPDEAGRFRIRDLLIWTVLIGVPLALVRLLLPLGGSGGLTITAGLRAIAIPVLLLLPLLWLAMLAGLAPRGWRRPWIYGAAIAIYAIAATAIAGREFHQLVLAPSGGRGRAGFCFSTALRLPACSFSVPRLFCGSIAGSSACSIGSSVGPRGERAPAPRSGREMSG